MDSKFYLFEVAQEFEPLNQYIEEIENYLMVEIVPIGGLHKKIKKPSEMPPRSVVENAYKEAAEVFFRLNPIELQEMVVSNKDVRDNVIVTITDLLLVLTDLTDRFKSKVQDADIILETNAAISRFTTAIREAIDGKGDYRFQKAKEVAEQMLQCALKVIEQSYSGIVVPSPENTSLSDSPMQFPCPDESELNCGAPSITETSYIKEIEWFKDNKACNTLFANDNYLWSEPFYVNDCLNRLWGKASRIRNNTHLEISQMAQMPRLVMYPFYAAFFDMASRLYDAVEQYKSGHLKPMRGSIALRNPLEGGQRLLLRMKDVLRYAPREYFESGRQHEVYTRLIGHIFSDIMDSLLKVISKDARFQCASHIERSKNAFGNIMQRLRSPAEGTEQSYVEENQRMVDGFRDEIYAISAILKCVESEIEEEKKAEDKTQNINTEPLGLSSMVCRKIDEIHNAVVPKNGRPTKGRAKFTQKDVATALGCSEDTIRRWENGKSKPPVGYSRELRECGSFESLEKFIEDYKSVHRVKDALNTKRVVRNMSEEQMYRESRK